MSPTLVFKDGDRQPRLLSHYHGRVADLLDVIDHGLNVAEAENAPRAHAQLYPDELRIERGISLDTIRLLEAMGHKVVVGKSMGSANSIVRRKDGISERRFIQGDRPEAGAELAMTTFSF